MDMLDMLFGTLCVVVVIIVGGLILDLILSHYFGNWEDLLKK